MKIRNSPKPSSAGDSSKAPSAKNLTLAGSVLDAIPLRALLLNSKGSVQMMNQAWESLPNIPIFPVKVGTNFVSLALAITGKNSTAAHKINDVLAGAIPDFSLEIAFESGTPPQKFLANVRFAFNASLPGVIATVEDVSHRHELETDLRKSQERFNLAIEGMQDGLWDWDLLTDSVYYSPIWGSMLGYDQDQIKPNLSSWTNLVHPDDLALAIHDIQMHRQGKTPVYKNVHRLRSRDGRWIYVEARGRCLRDANGRAIRMIGTVTDITERRRVEAQLLEQAALLDNARDAILVTSLEDEVLFWNMSAERIYGWTETEALGADAKKLFYRNPHVYLEARDRVLEKGFWSGELTQATKSGAEMVSEIRLTLVRDAEGEPKSILSINTDLTEKKRLEAQFLRAQRMESIGTLAGGIAHDLNNVLAPILMSVELLKMTNHTPSSIEVLTTIESSAQRGAEMVKQVLQFARGMEGRKQTIRPKQLIEDTQKLMRETFSKSIDVQTYVSSGVWPLLGDPTQLHQVLLNLCVNARDAMPKGGRLTISAENITLDENYLIKNFEAQPGPYVIFQISDTGCGISQEIRSKIFDPFFTTKALGKGTGLGLSTVMAIVKSHEGLVELASEIGKGTVFKIYLPASPALPASSTHETAAELPRGNGELVLIVDDEASVRTITEHTLLAFGYSVVTAGDGAEAVAIFAQHRKEVKVVITDMMMPIMDGSAAIHAFLKLEPGTRIIAASGLASNNQMAKAAAAGVRHFLPKPFTAEYLLKLIATVLREKDESPVNGRKP